MTKKTKHVKFNKNPVSNILEFDNRNPVIYLKQIKKELFKIINKDKNIIDILRELESKKYSNNTYYYNLWTKLKLYLKYYNISQNIENEWINNNVRKNIINRIRIIKIKIIKL